jgi:hypothetical protein
MTEQFIPHPPSPQPEKKDTVTFNKKNLAIAFLAVAIAILAIVLLAPSNNSSTTTDTVASSPVVTAAPAPAINKYDAYVEHVYNNSGQANSMTRATIIEYGDIICQSLDSGRTIPWITSYLSEYSNGQSDIELYASIVYGAVKHICPEYMPDMQAYLNS